MSKENRADKGTDFFRDLGVLRQLFTKRIREGYDLSEISGIEPMKLLKMGRLDETRALIKRLINRLNDPRLPKRVENDLIASRLLRSENGIALSWPCLCRDQGRRIFLISLSTKGEEDSIVRWKYNGKEFVGAKTLRRSGEEYLQLQACPATDKGIALGWLSLVTGKPVLKISFLINDELQKPFVVDSTEGITSFSICPLDGNKVLVAWERSGENTSFIYLAEFDGKEVRDRQIIESKNTYLHKPFLSSREGGDVWLMYEEQYGSFTKLYVRRYDDGLKEPILVPSGEGFNTDGAVVAGEDGLLWVAWCHQQEGLGHIEEAGFSSIDTGRNLVVSIYDGVRMEKKTGYEFTY